jgi:hypothetical protein
MKEQFLETGVQQTIALVLNSATALIELIEKKYHLGKTKEHRYVRV